ncbi:hypothetical protein [Cellulomonas humilata]|uniref:Uncharacterized protein n=1 Tax=Cellulomonas humilata TaxID=144055 RepID=A0ABU0EDM5_9CELL|nr:hypothetical protein [Cellulomonas humilata]MDQ0373376.1 hypothetical protein [Cellulomonas humilata]
MVTVPADLDVLAAPHVSSPTPTRFTAGDSVTLGAWDVFVAVAR